MPVELREQTIRIVDADHLEHVVALDCGGCSQIVAPDAAVRGALLEMLDSVPGSMRLTADGGMLGTLSVRENFALTLRYHGEEFEGCESMIEELFHQCGLSDAAMEELAAKLPIRISRIECWLAGFVRALVLCPTLLVFDDAFSGLTAAETRQLVEWQSLFRAYFPFRPALFIDPDVHSLPLIPDCPRIRL